MDVGPCRSCRRQVCWARSAKSGKAMPLESDDERGNVIVDAAGRAHVFRDHDAAVLAAGRFEGRSEGTFMSHHATCPRGKAWSGKTRRDPDAPAPEPAQTELL